MGFLIRIIRFFYLFSFRFTYEDQQNLLFLCVPLGAFLRGVTMYFAYVSFFLIANHDIRIFIYNINYII